MTPPPLPPPVIPIFEAYLPVALMAIVGVLFAAGAVVVSGFVLPKILGNFKPQVPGSVKMEPYECGVESEGSTRTMFFVRFYLVALLFLLFDMETIYIVSWALVFRDALPTPGAGPYLLSSMGVFMTVLVVGYIYAWKKGALTWS